jgi:hypothetical protein
VLKPHPALLLLALASFALAGGLTVGLVVALTLPRIGRALLRLRGE